MDCEAKEFEVCPLYSPEGIPVSPGMPTDTFDHVNRFIDAATVVNERTMSLALGGMGLILLVWAAVYGVKRDYTLDGFRAPSLLLLPFGLFVAAFLLIQVGVLSAFAGYRWEVMHGRVMATKDCGCLIGDAAANFRLNYAGSVQRASGQALTASVAAMLIVAIWFIGNVLARRGKAR